MLFSARFASLIAEGKVTETWRAWRRPQASVGSVQRVMGGRLIHIDAVDLLPLSVLDDRGARASGFADAAALRAELRKRRPDLSLDDEVYRVRFHDVGPDDRPRPGHGADLDAAAVERIRHRLDGHDRRSANGPWTAATLALIAEHPQRRAGDLAGMLGWERAPFKANVRKLKGLGLTESLEVGYRLSARGRAYLEAVAEPGVSPPRASRR